MGNQEIVFNKINNDLHLLSKIVFKQIFLCKVLFEQENAEDNIMDDVVNNEGIIDSIEVKLKQEIITSIVLYNPRASNLRKIVAYFEITGYLERIGDHLLNIAEAVDRIDKNNIIYTNCCDMIKKMFSKAETMVQNATFAFICNDNSLAHKTIIDDDQVDLLQKEIYDYISNPFAKIIISDSEDFVEEANNIVNNVMNINVIAANIERIADNATNISESAVYIIEGKDIKHKNNEDDEENINR